MRTSIILLVALSTFLISSCKDSITNPSTSPIIVMESNFENQVEPSLSGWRDIQPANGWQATKVSFSNDVPLNGTRWSLKVHYPDSLGSNLYYVFKPILPSQMRHYRLTFWYKGYPSTFQNYDVPLVVYGGGASFAQAGGGSSPSWTQDTVTCYAPTFVVDSLIVAIDVFRPGAVSDSSQYILFSSFKVEEY